MGRAKDEMMERQQEDGNRKIAEYLGITYDEYVEAGGEFYENTGNEGMVYDYYVQFDDDAPREILDKIKGLDKDNQVTLDLNWDEEDPGE